MHPTEVLEVLNELRSVTKGRLDNLEGRFGEMLEVMTPFSERFAGVVQQVEGFKDTRDALEAALTKLNRPSVGGGEHGEVQLGAEGRKTLNFAVRALFSGDSGAADRHFAELQATPEAKAMSVGIDSQGGYSVIPTFSAETTRIMLEVAPFITLPRTVEISMGDRFEEVVDKAEAGASWVGETGARTDTTTPDLGKIEIPAHEIYSMPKASQKLIDDSAFDIVSWLTSKVGEQFAYSEVSAFLTGNGVGKPRGFLTYPTAATEDATRPWGTIEHVVSGASGAFAASNPADYLVDLVSKLKAQYRTGAVWLMNRKTEAAARKLKDGQGRFLLNDSLQAGQPNQLLGYPVIETEQMPDLAAGSLSIAFGSFRKAYTIVRKLGDRFLPDPYTDKPNVRVYVYRRVGGAVNNFEACKLMKFSV